MKEKVFCKTCEFYDEHYKGSELGLCRVDMPKIEPSTGRAIWPIAEGEADWCGFHSDIG